MAKTLENYDPLVQIPSGMTPAGADFPIVESHDILVGENDKRLDAKLDDIDSAIGNVGQTPIATQLSSKVNTGDIVTSVAATGSTSNNKIPSETAVRAAIEAKTINIDSTVTEGSTNAVSGGAVHTQLATKQDTLTFDTTPTASSSNPVTSGGVKTALDAKQDTLTFDTAPTASSSNPVTSGGVKAALDTKQNTLTYETTPVVGSVNPVTSTGIRNAIDTAAAANLGAMQSQYDTFVNEAEDVLDRAASLSNGMVACSNIDAETTVGDTRILLYTGTTNANYTNGHWYYNSAASNAAPSWTDGGAVGSAPTIDNTLTTAGAAADSKSVGDAIENIVTISDTQPGSNSGNKVWIRETTDEEVQIPTYQEHISKANKADLTTNNESDNGSGTITASKAYAIGDHFYINNTNTSSENYGVSVLYKATAAIASGDAIVVGTNCEASKVADEITSLSNDIDTVNEYLDASGITGNVPVALTWEAGSFNNSGVESNTGVLATMIRTSNSVIVPNGEITATYHRTFDGLEGGTVIARLRVQKPDESVQIVTVGTSNYDIPYTITVEPGSSVRFYFIRSTGSEATLVTSDGNNLIENIYMSGITNVVPDASLTSENRPAQAKATGDAIGAIESDVSDLQDALIMTERIDFMWNTGYISSTGNNSGSTSTVYIRTKPYTKMPKSSFKLYIPTGIGCWVSIYSDERAASMTSQTRYDGTNGFVTINITAGYFFRLHIKYANDATISLSVGDGVYVIYDDTIGTVTTKIKDAQDVSRDASWMSFSMFQKVGVIGDSFASGSLHHPDDNGWTGNYAMSWPQILGRQTGAEVINFTKGGLSTKTWLENTTYGLSALLAANPQQLYIIALGINDNTQIDAGTLTLGSLSDINEDYTDNPDSFYGNYARIIGNIKTKAPYAKIVCLSVMRLAERNMDTHIQAIADACGVAFVNLLDDDYFTSDVYYGSMYSSHPIAYGYAGIAKAVERLINRCVLDDTAYFGTYYGIVTEDTSGEPDEDAV